MPTSKKPRKKYVKKVDFINPLEHKYGLNGQFRDIATRDLKDNNFTVKSLLNQGLLLYRWAFAYQQLNPDYSIVEICEFIEDEFLKIYELQKTATQEEIPEIRMMRIDISDEGREELLKFVDEIYKSFFRVRNKIRYAKIIKTAIVESNVRIGLFAPHMKHFIDRDFVEKELNICRNKINQAKKK